jgi:hypothetical protein
VVALQEDMSRAGVHADGKFREALGRPPAALSTMRTAWLRRRLAEGGADARSIAFSLFDQLLERRVADGYQLSVMLSRGTSSLQEMRALLARAEGVGGLRPSTSAYNALLCRLQLDGQDAREFEAILAEMEGLDLAPDEQTARIVHMSEEDQSAMRTAELSRRLMQYGPDDEAAWGLFGSLVKRGQCDCYQVNTMRSAARHAQATLAASGVDDVRARAGANSADGASGGEVGDGPDVDAPDVDAPDVDASEKAARKLAQNLELWRAAEASVRGQQDGVSASDLDLGGERDEGSIWHGFSWSSPR